MPSSHGTDLSWFHDAEQRDHSLAKDFSAAEIARRPWKAFWPPRSEVDVALWLGSEFAEVLSWSFDPDEPFDQPWRDWLKSPLMKCEPANHGEDISEENGNSCTIPEYTNEIQKLRMLASEQISKCRLPTATTCQREMHLAWTTDEADQISRLPKLLVECLTYLAPLKLYNTQKPYFSQLPCGTPLPRTNLVARGYPAEIRDLRGNEDLFKLDEAGFQFMQLPTGITHWTDENVQTEYLPNLSAWLKEYFDCEKVFIYNYNLRTSDTNQSGKGPWRSPIYRVHCDNTAESCARRLEFQFPTEAKAMLKGRYRYIDIWRCLAGPDIDAPLAFCDYRTVVPKDLFRIDIVYPHFSEEGYEVAYNPAHQWYYKKGMTKDDIVIFKLDDNLENVAKFAPHASFIDPVVSGKCKRTSIEVRAIIIG